MRFGLAFLGDQDSRGVVQWARELERRGHLSRLWVADEHFLRDPWVQLGAIAAVTSRVSIGICITDPYIRHPALTAAAAATLQELSGGRALLGLGAGSTGFPALGLTPRLPAQAVTECIELSRMLWSEPKTFSYRGRQIQFLDDCLDFKSDPIPIYVAARGPKMLTEIGYMIPADVLDCVEKSRHTWDANEVDWVVATLSQELVDDLTVAGDPSECVAKLRRLQDRGIDEVAILPFAPAGGNVRDMVELLFTKVAAALAA